MFTARQALQELVIVLIARACRARAALPLRSSFSSGRVSRKDALHVVQDQQTARLLQVGQQQT